MKHFETQGALLQEPVRRTPEKSRMALRRSRFKRDKWLYLLVTPGVLYFILFKYVPMWGVLIAFKNYQPFLGFWKSQWIGFENFHQFFINPDFFRLFRNTFILAFYQIIFFFPIPIILALLLNEVKFILYKKAVQTLVYLPHFISMVIVASITYVFLTTEGGIINDAIQHATGRQIDFLGNPHWFRPMIIIQMIWKEVGWSAIIFLAALAGVDMELYEAAIVDGAGRFRQLWHITLPALRSTIVIMLILRMGTFMDTGFEQILLMSNSLNRGVADVFDTYVYYVGITQSSFSFSTAVGLFKSVVGIVLVLGSNSLAKKFGETGLY